MKLSQINEDDLIAASGLQYAIKRMADPNYPEKIDKRRPPIIGGNYQALPNKVRQRQFLGFGPGKDDNTGNVRPVAAVAGDDNDPKNAHEAPIKRKMEQDYRHKLVRRKGRSVSNWGEN